MTSFNDVREWALTASLDEMEKLQKLMRLRRDQIGVSAGMSFKQGDPVCFDSKFDVIHGTFIKLNRKNARVLANTGATWTVSPHLLRKG